MVMLCLVCAWHALVSALPADKRKYWDNVALVAAVLLYIAFHGVFVLWMYLFVSIGALMPSIVHFYCNLHQVSFITCMMFRIEWKYLL